MKTTDDIQFIDKRRSQLLIVRGGLAALLVVIVAIIIFLSFIFAVSFIVNEMSITCDLIILSLFITTVSFPVIYIFCLLPSFIAGCTNTFLLFQLMVHLTDHKIFLLLLSVLVGGWFGLVAALSSFILFFLVTHSGQFMLTGTPVYIIGILLSASIAGILHSLVTLQWIIKPAKRVPQQPRAVC